MPPISRRASALARRLDRALDEMPGIQRLGERLSHALHSWILGGGERTRDLADTLHGTWLGHPLHPLLTDITIGAWTLAGGFDLIGVVSKDTFYRRVGDQLTMIGTASVIPTALAGLADYSTTPRPALPTATLHGLTNLAGTSLYLVSIYHRRRGRRGRGLLFSTLGLTTLTVGAWLGGRLVYTEGVGVDHAEGFTEPEDWTELLPADDLVEGEPRCVEFEGNQVLLYREGQRIHAIGAVCSHAGAPLAEGTFAGSRVECPWHQSVFDLRDGSVIHGPATKAQPYFEARIRAGQVEIRLPREEIPEVEVREEGEDEAVLDAAAD